MAIPTLIIDFDSTFISLESLDELARLALADSPNRAEALEQLSSLTDFGMEGKIGFGESLQRRLSMFRANRDHIQQLIELLRSNITPSIARNREFFRRHADRIYIISGGFTDYIYPVVESFELIPGHILANHFVFNGNGEITGCDKTCLLAGDDGKPKQVADLRLAAPVYVIGDGYTDYQIKACGHADKFFAFNENVSRSTVLECADTILTSFDQLVKQLG
jgi:D-3-phosphoglycerate dehydrogenase